MGEPSDQFSSWVVLANNDVRLRYSMREYVAEHSEQVNTGLEPDACIVVTDILREPDDAEEIKYC